MLPFVVRIERDAPPTRTDALEAATRGVLLSPRYAMTAGKAMAQAAHAAQLGWRASSAADRDAWRAGGFQLAVRTGAPRQWAPALESGAPVVHDAGFTEVEADAQTALAVLPWLVGRPAGYRASTEL